MRQKIHKSPLLRQKNILISKLSQIMYIILYQYDPADAIVRRPKIIEKYAGESGVIMSGVQK